MSNAALASLDRWLDRGILPLRPTYVRRFYPDGGRLGLRTRTGGALHPRRRFWKPERWIASCVPATNPSPVPDEGISFLAFRTPLSWPQALRLRGERILGPRHFAAYGPDFPVLTKLLDPGEPIAFHFHARDEDVWQDPARFGHRFGKDEAYYFLDAPKGPVPYTHVGLYPGVTLRTLLQAIHQGRERTLELSPVVHQRIGEGFFVPAGVPHRPGTALTLEIQQPSDVYTLLETTAGGTPLRPEQIHPGFPHLEEALRRLDFEAACAPDLLERNRLAPEGITHARGGEEAWIFPPRLRKFSGKRLVVRKRFESVEQAPYALFVWRGQGRLLGYPLRPGTEWFVTAEAACRPHLFEAEETLEVFKLFGPDPQTYGRRG
ncbi:MAG: hypothetical protein QN193_05140 [Armatimonadota bacterium]|nr:hypothetical protein [Armatimonadota bacterium]MDR7443307.1 hypothetical protein [Armatimonadota bacterium]MDR7569974.1 hypothetical protein [Armatimonadota bacterium]MDR7614363.1 hypothetical protein [Armatimonadota bacterium]